MMQGTAYCRMSVPMRSFPKNRFVSVSIFFFFPFCTKTACGPDACWIYADEPHALRSYCTGNGRFLSKVIFYKKAGQNSVLSALYTGCGFVVR